MGTDMFGWIERFDEKSNRWTAVRPFPAEGLESTELGLTHVTWPFRDRVYAIFAFLAGVRNYACCQPIAEPRGLPADCDLAGGLAAVDEVEPTAELHLSGSASLPGEFHSSSHVLLSELLQFDYEQVFWNRRVPKNGDGAALAEPGEGVYHTYRELLGPRYFEILDFLRCRAVPEQTRLVFFFGD